MRDDRKYSDDDIELLCLVRQGNESAFTKIYDKYAHVLYVFAMCYLKDEAAAEDAVQHIFMRLWERRERINITLNLKGYLYVAVKNYVQNYIRNKRVALLKNLEIYKNKQSVDDNLELSLERDEINTLLEQAIANLQNTKKQDIVRLRGQGFRNKEIAILLGIPEFTVKTYYAESVKLLRTHFKKILSTFIFFLLH